MRDPIDLAPGCFLDPDVGARRAHGERSDREPLDHLVGIVAQQPSVLERAGLALGRVAHRVGDRARVVAHGAPLHAGREPGPAPAPQAASPNLVDDPVGTSLGGEAQRTPAAPIDVLLHRSDRALGQQD